MVRNLEIVVLTGQSRLLYSPKKKNAFVGICFPDFGIPGRTKFGLEKYENGLASCPTQSKNTFTRIGEYVAVSLIQFYTSRFPSRWSSMSVIVQLPCEFRNVPAASFSVFTVISILSK